MKKRNLSKNSTRQKIKRESDPIPWKFCLLTLVCGVALVGGFFLAARSHFASIDLSIKNSDLKKQLQGLEDEKRRLLLLKEKTMSLDEIKKAAKKIGLTEITATNIENLEAKNQKTSMPEPEVKTADKKTSNEKQKRANLTVAENRELKSEKLVKATVSQAETRERRVSKSGK